MTTNLSNEFMIISKHRMKSHYYLKFKACLESLNNSQIIFKESESSNSIGGIVIHVIEHIKRNTQRLINPDIKYESGIENLFTDPVQDKEILIEHLQQTFAEFDIAISDAASLDMYNIYHLVEHTGYHLGQVVDRTQRLTGVKFQFVQNGIDEKSLKEAIDKELVKNMK
ncbi:DinB family protein [Cohnella abietis]|uniref:DUF1572 domain-containing protein n=1 Tax=Cohnella abietis TaxID=2507935 RepID=A0A3T1D891_9BACL|nr:DinB family protein [Cohnella abietis]BBI34301.1 hypothetical protein KCTCHS21_37000 [Cohnella abietis]